MSWATHAVALCALQVSVYLLNHSVVIKTVTLPELGERGFGYKHKYVQFATFRNEMAVCAATFLVRASMN